jgi:predicted transcriptional regulator
MPRVDAPTEVSGRDPEATLTEHAPSVMVADEHDADHLVERVRWALVDAEQPVKASHAHDRGSAAAAPARSVRRATARRASNRRATARSRQGDTEASIVEFLAGHPGSTAGDLAKGLNLNPASVSTRLTQLSKAGEIKRASHGYSIKQATEEN